MAIKDEVLSLVARDPRFAQALDQMENQVKDMDMAPDDLDEIIQILETMLQHPESYEEILKAALADGMVEKDFFPPQMDPTFIVSLLAALYGLQDRFSQPMARGGLASIAAQGRHGDTMLAHISPAEARLLKRHGGAGSINPRTGLPEYFKLFSFLKKIAPIALAVIAPMAAPAIGGAISSGLGLGLGTTAATALGGAALGAGTAALTGQNILKGGLTGGIMSGAGSMLGGALGIENPMLQSVVGNALAGGAAGMLGGQGFGAGALQGAIGGGISNYAGQNLSGALQSAGQTFGNALSAGYSPGQATTSAALAGIARSIMPSDAAVQQTQASKNWLESSQPAGQIGADLQSPDVFDMTTGYTGGLQQTPSGDLINPNLVGQTASSMSAVPSMMAKMASSASGGIPWGTLAMLGAGTMLASDLVKAPPQVKQEVSKLSPKQQEYFNRPAKKWDWDRMARDAARQNMTLGDYVARNWNTVAGGAYSEELKAAQGGALSAIAKFAKGAGSGRDDTIDAKLSDGEYVMDAETVALLGDGSSDEGARRLDRMRSEIRKQKGKALMKGKFSPNAKSPLAYLKGIA